MRTDPPPVEGPAGLYLHFPFCSVRCGYCDFPTVAGRDHEIEGYLDALEREIGSPSRPSGSITETAWSEPCIYEWIRSCEGGSMRQTCCRTRTSRSRSGSENTTIASLRRSICGFAS